MAIALRLTDGTTTVTITDTTTAIMQAWQPAPDSLSGQIVWSRDGGELAGSSRSPIVEDIQLFLIGGQAAVRDAARDIIRLLDQAALRQRQRTVAPVYLEVQLDYDGTDWWRAEVLIGTLSAGPNVFDYEWLDGDLSFVLSVTRRPFWEQSALTTMYISSRTTTRTQGGVAIEWTYDSTQGNYVEIAAADVPYDLPFPIYINLRSFEDGSASTDVKIQRVYIGHISPLGTADNLTLQDSDATYNTGTFSVTPFTGLPTTVLSNGDYTSVSGAASAVDTWLCYWLFDYRSLLGRRLRVLAGMLFSENNEYRLRVSSDTSGGFDLYTGEWITGNATTGRVLMDFGMLVLPVLQYDIGGSAQVYLLIDVRSSSYDATEVDFLQLMPTDGWTELWSDDNPVDTTGDSSNQIIDDRSRGQGVYKIVPVALTEPGWYGQGEILIRPQETQRLYILAVSPDGRPGESVSGVLALFEDVTIAARQRRSLL